MAKTELFTIGVYGWEADRFFAALRSAGIDTFCDIRARRGVRGSDYTFANSARLQQRLAELGIHYIHRPDLAPAREVRSAQHKRDEAAKVGKRQRTALSEEFTNAYLNGPLASFDSTAFLESLGEEANRIVFMCVEREPSACHRGLLADRLARDLRLEVKHLTP